MATRSWVLRGWMVVSILFVPWGLRAPILAEEGTKDPSKSLAPFVPTPMEVVEKLLELAEVKKGDVVYDLGCGDGRIVVTAAKKFGATGVGVDYDPQRVKEARQRAKDEGVEDLVKIIQQDAMKVDFTGATVVTLYLLPSSNVKLRPNLHRYLKPGARVVSHDFDTRGWKAEKEIDFEDSDGGRHSLYLWRIKAPASGVWSWSLPTVPDEEMKCRLCVREEGGKITGEFHGARGVEQSITRGSFDGEDLEVIVQPKQKGQGSRKTFKGTVKGDTIEGTVEIEDGRYPGKHKWLAGREPVKLAGTWKWKGSDGEEETLQIEEKERFRGTVVTGRGKFSIEKATRTGSLLCFDVTVVGAKGNTGLSYKGWVEGDRISGTVTVDRPGSDPTPWVAERAE